MPRGAAEDQLNNYKGTPSSITNSSGRPVGTRDASLTVGTKGPILLQDHQLIDELAHFDRERIPERVVHAKGAGAFGYFEVTHDITKYCSAKVFEKVGKRTKIAVRFSTVGGENGSADTVRDPRGFAVKFYTDDGIWDLVGNNTPIFFIRDPILFSSFIHTQKRNPATHLKDPDMFWDFISLRPETTHQVMFLFADRGIPDGYRFMNGYGSHTFKTVNKEGKAVYVKFHYKSNQGIKNLEVSKADHLSGADPDYSIRDLYNAIAKGDYPQYNMSIQVMTFDEAEKFKYNPFDLTKIWSHKEFPLIPVGKLVLNRNPSNYFAEVEQIAFAPSHMVPGIEPSPDKMLQGRLFSYNDTHRHRLGANYLHLPVNCPYRVTPSLGVLTKPGDVEVEVPAGCTKNFQRDGPQAFVHEGGAPNYFPNSFGGPTECERAKNLEVPFRVTGDVCRYSSGDSEDNFGQPRDFWQNVLDEAARKRLVSNIAGHLKNASGFIQERTVKNFAQVDVDFGRQLTEALKLAKSANL